MPLLALWTSNPAAIGESTIEQIVAIAGDGNLRDGSPCSRELREYWRNVIRRSLQHMWVTVSPRGSREAEWSFKT